MLLELRASLIQVRVCPNLGKLILWLSTLQNCTNEELLNKQVQHFPNLYLTKIAGLQTESFSNLRTSAVCRTHVSQKNEKGFYIKRALLVDTLVNSTYIVCFLFETWLVCCSCIMFQAQKTIPRYHSVFRYGDFQDGFLPKQLRAGNILFGKCPFPTKPFFLYNPLPEMKI